MAPHISLSAVTAFIKKCMTFNILTSCIVALVLVLASVPTLYSVFLRFLALNPSEYLWFFGCCVVLANAPIFLLLALCWAPGSKIGVNRYICGEEGSMQREVIKILSHATVRVLPEASRELIMASASMACYFIGSLAFCAETQDIEYIIKPMAFGACIVGVELLFHSQFLPAFFMIICGLLGYLIFYARVKRGANLYAMSTHYD